MRCGPGFVLYGLVVGQFEGYGLQPVHKPHKIQRALAPEGISFFKLTHHGFQPVIRALAPQPFTITSMHQVTFFSTRLTCPDL
jgi:hypothetical protein